MCKLLLAAALAVVSIARADIVTYSASRSALISNAAVASFTDYYLLFPQFDPTLGTLDAIGLTLTTKAIGSYVELYGATPSYSLTVHSSASFAGTGVGLSGSAHQSGTDPNTPPSFCTGPHPCYGGASLTFEMTETFSTLDRELFTGTGFMRSDLTGSVELTSIITYSLLSNIRWDGTLEYDYTATVATPEPRWTAAMLLALLVIGAGIAARVRLIGSLLGR